MTTKITRGEAIRPLVGANGRLYFNYCLGAEFLCEEVRQVTAGNRAAPQFRRFVYKVERCEYIDGREYYYISRDGRAISSPFTVNRLHYVLHFSQIDELAAGTRQELPLTADEVRVYYAARAERYEARREEALRILKGIPRYMSLNKMQTQLCIRMGYAEAQGADCTELESKYRSVCDEIDELCRAAGIDPQYLKERERCQKCGGSGLNAAGEPCSCALRIEETIKDYCARLRIAGSSRRE